MRLWQFFDSRARRLGILDTKLVQGAAMFLALVVAKLFPVILTVDIRWFAGLCVLFAIKPVITFFGPEKRLNSPARS